MQAAYAGAERFLRPQPAMPMDQLANLHSIGPIIQAGRRRPDGLRQRLGLGAGTQLVLVSMGGIATRPPMEDWPRVPGLCWLVPRSWQVRRPDARVLEDSGFGFADLLASSDALVTKPGYGSFTEAAGCGIPVLYVRRDGWPEQDCLVQWLQAHAHCTEVAPEALEGGALVEPLLALLAQGRYAAVAGSGIDEALGLIEPWLAGTP